MQHSTAQCHADFMSQCLTKLRPLVLLCYATACLRRMTTQSARYEDTATFLLSLLAMALTTPIFHITAREGLPQHIPTAPYTSNHLLPILQHAPVNCAVLSREQQQNTNTGGTAGGHTFFTSKSANMLSPVLDHWCVLLRILLPAQRLKERANRAAEPITSTAG